MPQLNPDPWFNILVFSWAIFLIFLPTKVMSHTFPNAPSQQKLEKAGTAPWTWPWH
uniref:ATP synthase complex subunit 8 n=1 Tax=Sillago sinica TaxID=907714 RepID=A0A172DDH6_9TELE|nr:ATP synthase F0 subunit 8 [Sillago sinica]ALI30772.1 ATP synthase F0 subunit 8 [Sillago sinica]